MKRCRDFNECRKHFDPRGRIKTVSSTDGVSISEIFTCIICGRRWKDQYVYQNTIDVSFHGDPPVQDETYGTVISESRTIESY